MSSTAEWERPFAVIGAGVAGLTAALTLARHGRSCVIFEASERVGGLCATVDADGVAVEPGATVVIGARMLSEVLGSVGADPGELLAPDDPVVRVLLPGRRIDLVAPTERLTDTLAGVSAADAAGLGRLVADGVRMADRLPRALRAYKLGPLADGARTVSLLPWLAFSYRTLVRRAVGDPGLRDALEAFSWFYGGLPAARAPAALAVMPALAIAEGGFRVAGGIQRLADHLAARLVTVGGEICLGQPVLRLATRDGRVASVGTAAGTTAVRGVVAACDIAVTAGLVPRRAGIRMALRTAPLRRSLACVSVFGRSPAAKRLPRMTWAIGRARELRSVGRGGLLPFAAVAVGPGGSVRIGGALRGGNGAQGVGETLGRDGLSAQLRSLVAGAGLELALEPCGTWTPRDYERRLGLPGGAAFGFEPSRTQLGPGRYGPRTPLANLVVAGQSCYPGFGIPLTALSGQIAAEALLS
jgi:phytoene desaturase